MRRRIKMPFEKIFGTNDKTYCVNEQTEELLEVVTKPAVLEDCPKEVVIEYANYLRQKHKRIGGQ
jgi:hypothetical protein